MTAASTQRVLYVDDEPTLVFLITRALQKLGIASDGFASAEEALAAFGREPQAFSLVLTDLTMPGSMSGLELAQAVLAIRPDAAVVIASGAIAPAEARRAAAVGVRTVIQKPAKVAEMAQLVSGLLKEWA
ncbi:MAG TPA: response regulator [Steroidobacteraceae bacterium]|nr:response regulator [Steroidobacteraceae bacterium]